MEEGAKGLRGRREGGKEEAREAGTWQSARRSMGSGWGREYTIAKRTEGIYELPNVGRDMVVLSP